MKCYYDFHIHSCLSPCGDIDMTPNNIVNMSVIKGLDAIAVTDHNCGENLPALYECAKGKLTLLFGMEVESCEEVHMVCLFATYNDCKKMQDRILEDKNHIKNDADIFGEQIIMDENDNIVGSVDELLVSATNLSVYDVVSAAHEYGGVCIAAHVDKSSYSILSNLGFIPDDLEIDCIEVSKNKDYDELLREWEYLGKYKSVFSSDAHYLMDISEKINYIDVDSLDAHSIIDALRRK